MSEHLNETQLSSVDSGYAKRRKEHLALINQLRAIGAQADLDLPRVAVIGNQSAGKSSLVEAISGISVPRDAGTCTRCPMECRLASSSGPWQCQVSIRWEYTADGLPLDEVREDTFGDIIAKKADVELALRRAQYAVLHPRQKPQKAMNMTAEQLKHTTKDTLNFSKNVVCVDLMGPELTDLAFVDLPGIIQNADAETVKLVEDLVRSHIKGNCLILVTVPMSDDIENQKAMQIAKNEDPSGLRTIGVMTKPDTLTSGATKAREIWMDVIEGRRFPLRHGYYCTRQPDDDERMSGVSAEQARTAEMDFFGKTSPWSRSTQTQRFGTRNLIANLSKLLSQVIDDTLPKLQNEVTNQLQFCNARLSTLPPAITTEPSAYVLSAVTSFCNDIFLLVKGSSQNASLVQTTRRTYASFKSDIRGSAPKFVPYLSAKEASVGEWDDIDDDDDFEEGDAVNVGVAGEDGLLYLDDVRRHIESSLTRELPNNVPYSAKVALIQKSQEYWELHSSKCLDAVQKAVEKAVSRLVNDQFQRYDSLKSRLMHNIMDLFRAKHAETWKQILFVLQCEGSPYTQNGHYLQVTKDKYLAKYRNTRSGRAGFNDQLTPKRRKTTVGGNFSTTQASAPGPFTFDFSVAQDTELQKKGSSPSVSSPLFGSKSQSQNQASVPSPARQRASPAQSVQPSPLGTPTPNDAPAATSVPNPCGAPATPASGPFLFSSSVGSPPLTTPGQKRPSMDPEERQQLETEALALLVKLGYTNTSVEDFGKLVPPDIYEQEMDVMAEVRAYFSVSYKRVIDNIPMTIDNMFLFAFARALQPYLIEKLGLGSATSAARCAGYLAEDPHVVAEREELSARRKRLQSVQHELFNFGL